MLTYTFRARHAQNAVARRLLVLMDRKKSNVCAAADFTTTAEVLRFADRVGPYVCMIKTHADIVVDFNAESMRQLTELAEKHDFLIFEDRKFADIGNTVKEQLTGGHTQISKWAHIVNTHILPGPGILHALTADDAAKDRGLLLIAEMSSQGHMITEAYRSTAVAIANSNLVHVAGFIAQSPLVDADLGLVNMQPGVHIQHSADSLGQGYREPREAVLRCGADVIIVGRGISVASDHAAAAQLYREAGWDAYVEKIKA